MFGLHFNVNAGRCTRGAYVQLLPLDDSLRQMIDCDFMLIVDTEGLRAPELQLEGVKHDNELATFVIGLADATIINIFGETPGDLDDILQTSLHAFIRMRKIEMKPGCLFVHQNVPDILASSKNMLGRQQFQGKLDKMTQAAAKVENCEGQFSLFSHIIEFDDSKDVFYFPSLWKGDPPMAPVNVGYSESAQTLKTALKELTHKKSTFRCSLETFKMRVERLWEAVLQENFVFSFKNTLEVCAYTELDSEYAQWSWTLQSRMLEWENKAKWKIDGCDDEKSKIEEVAEDCFKEASENILPTTYVAVLAKMESYLDSSDHSATLSQWKHKTELRLKDLYDETKRHARKFCNDLVANKLNYVEVHKLQKGHIKVIQDHIRDLVDESWKAGTQYTKQEIKNKFEEKWTEWIEEFQTTKKMAVKYPSSDEIETKIGETLRVLLQTSDQHIIKKLTDEPLSKRSLSLTLEIDKKTHIDSKRNFLMRQLMLGHDIYEATNLTNKCLIQAREDLNTIKKESRPFHASLVYQLIKDLINNIDDALGEAAKQEKRNFTFTPEYKVDMALTVCAYALDVFKQTTRKIEADNDPIKRLDELKGTFLTNFEDEYSRVNNETKAANSLCGLLNTSIEEALLANLETVIVDEIQKDEYRLSSKAKFKIQVLDDLANNIIGFSKAQLFEHYKTYLTDMRMCFQYWAKYYIEKYCTSSTEHCGSSSVITRLALKQLLIIIDGITSTINDLCKPAYNIHDIQSWLNKFATKLEGSIPLQKSTMDKLVGECDVSKFSKYVLGGIKDIEDALKIRYSDTPWLIRQMSSRNRSPEWLLYKRLIGCTAMCPFCGEQCERTNPCTEDHCIKLHRYLSLGRWYYHETHQLVLRTCTDYVGTHESFIRKDGEKHPFFCYKQVYTDWEINPYTAEPAYWKWFVNKFHAEIQDWVEASPTNIPKGWDKVSFEEAVDSLPRIIHSN